MSKKIAVIGECMIELSEKGAAVNRGFGGDTLNTSVYIARQTDASALAGVSRGLPEWQRALKLQKRAARQGFDWVNTEGPADKLREEMAELAAATTDEDKAEEAGDLLFAAVNLVRAHGVAAEDALRAANAKFERRYRAMEALATARGQDFAALDLTAQEELWQAVKRSEAGKAA